MVNKKVTKKSITTVIVSGKTILVGDKATLLIKAQCYESNQGPTPSHTCSITNRLRIRTNITRIICYELWLMTIVFRIIVQCMYICNPSLRFLQFHGVCFSKVFCYFLRFILIAILAKMTLFIYYF